MNMGLAVLLLMLIALVHSFPRPSEQFTSVVDVLDYQSNQEYLLMTYYDGTASQQAVYAPNNSLVATYSITDCKNGNIFSYEGEGAACETYCTHKKDCEGETCQCEVDDVWEYLQYSKNIGRCPKTPSQGNYWYVSMDSSSMGFCFDGNTPIYADVVYGKVLNVTMYFKDFIVGVPDQKIFALPENCVCV